jgi:hypothetical protein
MSDLPVWWLLRDRYSAFPRQWGRPLGLSAVQCCSKRHASRSRRAVGGGWEPPGVGPRGAARLGWVRVRAACGS